MFRGVAGAIFAVSFFLTLILGTTWVVQGNNFFMYKYFAPKEESVRRETFEQSKAYREGAVQELQNMQFEYINADEEHKAALASIILHRVADFPEDALPDDLKQFIQELRQKKLKKQY